MIRRFQDIDKLKLILLNDNQRKLFEHIPKLKISKNSRNTGKSTFTLNMIKSRKNIFPNMSHREITENLQLEENNPITRSILDMIDPNLMDEIKSSNNGSSIYNSFLIID